MTNPGRENHDAVRIDTPDFEDVLTCVFDIQELEQRTLLALLEECPKRKMDRDACFRLFGERNRDLIVPGGEVPDGIDALH